MTSPQKRLFSPAQVAVASLIGSPLPGFYLIARNYGAAGLQKNARTMLIIGFVVTGLLVAIGFSLPDRTPHSLLPIISTVCVHQIAKTAQGALIVQHRAAGGRLSSWWLTIGLGLLGMLVVLAVAVGITFALPE